MLNRVNERIQKLIYIVLLYYFCIYIPLFMCDGFFDILESKFYEIYNARYYIYGLLCIAMLLIIAQNRQKLKSLFTRFDMLLVVFGIISFISSRLSLSFMSSWKGVSGFCVGGFIVTLAIMLIIVLSKLKRPEEIFFLPVYIVNVIILILAIIEGMGFDPLGTHQQLVGYQYFIYFSTIGNTNWFSGYLCVILMLSFGYYVSTEKALRKILSLIMLSLSLMCLIVLYVDSAFVGIVFCAFFALPYIIDDGNRLKRFADSVLIFGLCLMAVAYLPFFSGLRASHNSGIMTVILSRNYAVLVLVIAVFIFYLVYTMDKNWFDTNKKRILWVIEGFLFVFVVAVLLFTVVRQGSSWGNGRSEIWSHSLAKFSEFSLKNKLIGIGPENLASVYSNFSVENGAFLTTAHSEPIQFLLTMGILGFAVYMGLWICCFHNYFVSKIWLNSTKIIYFMAICAYFGQSLINSATIPNVMLLCFVVSEFLRSNC